MERLKSFFAMEGNIPILLMCYFVLGFSLGLWDPILNIYLDAIGIPIVLIGLTSTIRQTCLSAVTMPIGALSDKVGRKKPILASFILTLIVTVAFLLTRRVFLLMLVFAVHGTAIGMRVTSTTAYIADSVKPQRRGTAFATYSFFQMLSSVLGTFIGAVVADYLGYSTPFLVAAVLVASSIPFVYFLLKEPRVGDLKPVRGSIISSLKESLPNASRFLRKKEISILMLGILCHSFSTSLVLPFLGLYAKNVLGYVLASVGGLLSLRRMGGLVGLIPNGKLIDRFGGELGYLIHVFSTAPIVYFFIMFRGFYATLLVLISWGFFMGLDMASVRTMVVEFAGDEGKGAALGTIQSFQGIVGVVSPMIGGWLWSYVSPESPFIVCMTLNFIGSVPLAVMALRKRKVITSLSNDSISLSLQREGKEKT